MTDEGLMNLIGAMFRLAAQDLRYGNKKIQRKTIKFLESDWFCFICQEMNLNAKRVKRLMINNAVCMRHSYEDKKWSE